jgi:NADH-quinone oxidoreductase subunit L
VTEAAALLTVLIPAATAVLGLPLLAGRSRELSRDWAVLGTVAATVAAGVELYGVTHGRATGAIGFLGRVDTGVAVLGLNLAADSLSAVMAVAVGVVASCVQLYSVAYLHLNHGSADQAGAAPAPVRYPAYAATVSLFTAAMMLVVHAGDLVLLLIGWEVMGLASYLLIGQHSERPAARAAAVKALLVTRFGDVGVLLAVVILLTGANTTTIADLNSRATFGQLPPGVALAAALLLLAGVAGKSAQFPLHTWLPDAMEGPTPISALIHAATMVAAGVFLVVRLLPVFLAAPAALAVAAVIAAISMLGAALAALAQDDLKRLLAWSTISQVGYMLGAVSVARDAAGGAPAIFHLLSHAAFKSLLFLVAGCAIWLAGTGQLRRMGGLRRRRPYLSLLLGLGLAGLAGLPPLGGFWSKESVLTAAEQAASDGRWTGWLVYLSALVTTLVTGLYAGRAWAMVALNPPPAERSVAVAPAPDQPAVEHDLDDIPWVPVAMIVPLVVLAVPTLLVGLLLLDPPAAIAGSHVSLATALTGSLLALAGFGWAASAPRLGAVDPADVIPARLRAWLRDGYRLDDVQNMLVVRPVQALARVVGVADRDVVDGYVRGSARLAEWTGLAASQLQTGLATGYLLWVAVGAVLAGAAAVVLS